MRRIVILLLLYAIMLIFSVDLGYAQSFRNYASGDLLYGDFDNDIDPIYIWENDGYRIYTTLSNLSSQTDRFLSNSSNDVYLMGISGNFGIPPVSGWESRTMFLVELADSRADYASGLDTDFDGTADLSGQGYMSGDRVQLIDDDGDNVFDIKDVYGSTADNYILWKSRDWQIVHGYRKGDKNLGISFKHTGYGNNYTEYNTHNSMFKPGIIRCYD